MVEVYFMKLIDLDKMKGKIKREKAMSITLPFKMITRGLLVKIPSITF